MLFETDVHENLVGELRKLQTVFPGARLGGSCVYAAKGHSQTPDFFIPVDPFFNVRDFFETLVRSGLEGVKSSCVRLTFQELNKFESRYHNFFILPLGKGGNVAEWMNNFQPIRQQAAMTDGHFYINTDEVRCDEITVDLSRVHSYREVQLITRRGAKMAEKYNLPLKLVGELQPWVPLGALSHRLI